MELRNKIQSVLSKYGLSLEDEVQETEMATAQLEDGTTVHCDGGFQKGDTCYVVNEEGEKIGLPDGEYVLQEGGKFTIEEGTITASDVEAPAEEEKPAEEAPAEETTTEKEEEKVMEDEEEVEQEEEEEEEKMGDKRKYSRHEMSSAIAEIATALKKEHAVQLKAKDKEIQKLKKQLEKDRKRGIARTPNKEAKAEPVKVHFTEAQLAAHKIFAQYSR